MKAQATATAGVTGSSAIIFDFELLSVHVFMAGIGSVVALIILPKQEGVNHIKQHFWYGIASCLMAVVFYKLGENRPFEEAGYWIKEFYDLDSDLRAFTFAFLLPTIARFKNLKTWIKAWLQK